MYLVILIHLELASLKPEFTILPLYDTELVQCNQFMASTFSSGGSGLILCRSWLVDINIVYIYNNLF
jgi:hypothetical protein